MIGIIAANTHKDVNQLLMIDQGDVINLYQDSGRYQVVFWYNMFKLIFGCKE